MDEALDEEIAMEYSDGELPDKVDDKPGAELPGCEGATPVFQLDQTERRDFWQKVGTC